VGVGITEEMGTRIVFEGKTSISEASMTFKVLVI